MILPIRAGQAALAIHGFIACSVLVRLLGLAIALRSARVEPSTIRLYWLSGWAAQVLFALSAVLIARWIYHAHGTFNANRHDPSEISPAWAVGWFLVPVANFIMPYAAMRQLVNRSFGPGSVAAQAAPLRRWWLALLAGGILEYLGNPLAEREPMLAGMTLLAVGTGLRIISAWLLLRIIGAVTDAQIQRCAPIRPPA
ncbi:MAG: hypothetical protein RLZZ427_80 [Pseudomonadota bacterium]|jgi:hypothetical protein